MIAVVGVRHNGSGSGGGSASGSGSGSCHFYSEDCS